MSRIDPWTRTTPASDRNGSVSVFALLHLSRTVTCGVSLRPVSDSDRAGEFGERGLDAPVAARVGAEFVVAASDVLHARMTTDDRSC